MADSITPPGKARIIPCCECKGTTRGDCVECHGAGWHVMRACPLCGDLAWDYVNGADEHDGMACRIRCGHTWTAADPGWQAQVLPSAPT